MNMNNIIGMMKTPKRFVFVRYQRKINLHFPVSPGDIICFRVQENLDPDKSPEFCGEMFDDHTFKDLVTANVKIAWGNVLRKFGGIALPGGVMLEGSTLVEEGNAEQEAVIQRLINMVPLGIIRG